MSDLKSEISNLKSERSNPIRLSRRQAIQWISAAAATVSALDARSFGHTSLPSRIGSDPNLLNPVVPWPRTLTPEQLRTVAALCDTILPADDRSPAASAIGVPDFIDEWISAPYEEQQADRKRILEGLEWLDKESVARFNKPFAELDEPQRQHICDDIRSPAKARREHLQAAAFFAKFRNLTTGAFYTTPEGMKDLQYIGNVPLATFDGPPREVLAHLKLL